MLPIIPMFVLIIAPHFEMLVNKKGLQRLFIILIAVFSLLFTIIGLAGILDVENVSRLTAKYFVNPWYWMATLGVFGLLLSTFLRKQTIKLYTIFIVGLWLSYDLWTAPMVDKAFSTQPMMYAIAKVIPKGAELGIVGFREKLLLHSQWPSTHFGHHHPKAGQQQAAINWIKQNTNRYLLVSSRYLNDCFKSDLSIEYASFHKAKWLLFDNEKLQSENCIIDDESYAEFSTKIK
ncbi:MAG: hypothetical protein JKY19_10915 [Alcanivoracaceae bacterium]|nr:hypothetical protein [Alcanivoracaceae bacterium]